MAINMDGVAGPAALPGQADRRQAEVRRGRWLYELEHALLLEGGKKTAVAERPQAELRQQDDAPAASARAADISGAGDAPAGAGAAAGAQPAAVAPPASAAATSRAVAGAAATAENAAPAAGGRQGAAQGAAPAVSGDAANVLPAVLQQTPALLHSAALATYAQAGRSAMLLGGADGVAAGIEAPLKAAGAGAINLSLMPPLAQAENAPAQSATEQADAEPPAQSAARDAAASQDYASTLLHVYHGADGVQAWLRDANIGAGLAANLAQTMAQELGGAGARLAALTVNGKKQLLAAAAAQDDFMDDSGTFAPHGGPQAVQAPNNPHGVV